MGRPQSTGVDEGTRGVRRESSGWVVLACDWPDCGVRCGGHGVFFDPAGGTRTLDVGDVQRNGERDTVVSNGPAVLVWCGVVGAVD